MIFKLGRAERAHLPYAFTEQGVAMLSSVLNSERAVKVNIAIMRAFVNLREALETNRELARKFAELEKRVGKHDEEIDAIIDAIRQLMAPPEKPEREIGFHVREKIAALSDAETADDRLDHLPHVCWRAGAALLPRFFARWIALATAWPVSATSLLAFFDAQNAETFNTIVRVPWVPTLGMEFHLAVDGISLTLALVTGLTAVSAVLFSWDVEKRPNEFFFWLLLVVGGSYGVFLSADLFLLFVFYELVIVPKYFLIAIWGSTNKEYGAMKLTLYSFFGGALVFIGILAAYVTARIARSSAARAIQIRAAISSLGVPRLVPRIRRPRRHLAVAHLGADRSRRRADGRFDVARRDRDETGRLRLRSAWR